MAKNKSDKKKFKLVSQPTVFHEMADILNSDYAHETARCLAVADSLPQDSREKANMIAEAQVYASLHHTARMTKANRMTVSAEELGYVAPSNIGREPEMDEAVAPGVGG